MLMPPIVQFTSETTRDKHWDSIVAIHSGLVMATTWSFDKRKMGELKLVPEKFKDGKRTDFKAVASCINMSHCGNFVTIGYSSGDVERFNMQSGVHRATYGSPAHTSDVRGIWMDNLNQMVITGGVDGYVKFWNFKSTTNTTIGVIKLSDSILMFRGHRESSMLCVVLEDFTILVIDYDTKNIVRKFVGHTAPITDADFTPDGRWLITSSMDCTIRTWDIPSSYLIDQFKMSQPCISLCVSPTGDFLATAHVDFLGVYLWSNKTLYEHVSLRSIDPETEAPSMELPNMSHFENITDMIDNVKLENDDEDGECITTNYETPLQIDDNLITMSTLAEASWKNLLNLDVIKKRNKPKEPLKKPKQAPFFLPTVAGLDIHFDLNGDAIDADGESRVKTTTTFENLTSFGAVLKKSESGDFQNAINHIIKLNPSMIDYEIRSLAPIAGGTIELMAKFMEMIVSMLDSRRNFELAQSYLALFLKVHEEIISSSEKLVVMLDAVERAQNESWARLESKLLYGIGVVSNLRNYC